MTDEEDYPIIKCRRCGKTMKSHTEIMAACHDCHEIATVTYRKSKRVYAI
jgi:hypothetical protein